MGASDADVKCLRLLTGCIFATNKNRGTYCCRWLMLFLLLFPPLMLVCYFNRASVLPIPDTSISMCTFMTFTLCGLQQQTKAIGDRRHCFTAHAVYVNCNIGGGKLEQDDRSTY
jgi:hypothetical protein